MAKLQYTQENIEAIAAGMTCEQCDEMFQECMNEVDPDNPLGYEICQILWDRCKSQCTGASMLTRAQTRVVVKQGYARALSKT